MPFDEIPWYPAIAGPSLGQDSYRVPGSTFLNGTKGSGPPTPIHHGDASHYSPIPTTAQLTNGPTFPLVGGMNQVVGYLVKRIKQYCSTFGFSVPPLPGYWPVANSNEAAQVVTIRNAINLLRSGEGLTPFIFVAPLQTGHKRLGAVIEELRQALGISGILTLGQPSALNASPAFTFFYRRRDNPYGTPSFEDGGGNLDLIGKTLAATGIDRVRYCIQYNMPSWVFPANGNIINMVILFNVQSVVKSPEDFTGAFYFSSSDDNAKARAGNLTPSYAGFAYNTGGTKGNQIGTFASSIGLNVQQSMNVPIPLRGLISDFAGAHPSFILATSQEIAGSGSGVPSGYALNNISINPGQTLINALLQITFS